VAFLSAPLHHGQVSPQLGSDPASSSLLPYQTNPFQLIGTVQRPPPRPHAWRGHGAAITASAFTGHAGVDLSPWDALSQRREECFRHLNRINIARADASAMCRTK
jgi:hypothetical protein